MARFILVACVLFLTLQGGKSEEDSPLLDLASSFLQNLGDGGDNKMEGLATIGNLVGSLMQGDNAKNLGAMFGQADGGNAGDVLAGLGSLLGGQDGKIDPSVIGSMLSMVAQQMTTEAPKTEKRAKRDSSDGNIDMGNLLNMASGFLGQKNSANLLPVIMNTISAFSGQEAEKRSHNHQDHASFLPPYLEKLHLYWDLFINSELGKTIWEKSGLRRAMKAFTGPDGNISVELMMKSFENQSFRRHWIKAAASYLTGAVVSIAQPEAYQRYMVSIQFVVNSFLDSQNMPKSTHFDMKRPEKTITALLNFSLKRYLDIDTDVREYVKPAVAYLKQTLKMAEATSKTVTNRADYNALVDRMTDTLNLEVIEPVLRVYRAYKHSVEAPHCQEHLMCLVNRHPDQDKSKLAGFKAGLTKVSSIAASAALSFNNGKGFWDLYNAIQNDVNCEAAYPADCAAFHEHELKVTTEGYHSEL